MFRSAALPRQCEDTYNSSYNTGDAFAGKDSLGSYDGRNVAGRCQCYLAIFPIKSLDGLHRKTDAYCCGALVQGRCARIVGQIHQSIFASWFPSGVVTLVIGYYGIETRAVRGSIMGMVGASPGAMAIRI